MLLTVEKIRKTMEKYYSIMGADVLLTCRSPCPIVSSNPLLLSGLHSPADADHHPSARRRGAGQTF